MAHAQSYAVAIVSYFAQTAVYPQCGISLDHISDSPLFTSFYDTNTHTYIDQGYTTQKIISQCDVKLNFRHSCVGTRCAQLQIPPTTRCFRVYMCFISLYCTSYYCFVVGTDPRCFVRQNCAGCRCPTRLQYQA